MGNWSFPPVLEKIKNDVIKFLNKLEKDYNKSEGFDLETELLSSHTLRVSRVARGLAISEKLDPNPVYVAALFHDVGKFMWKTRDEFKDLKEETISATIAEEKLKHYDLDLEFIDKVVKILTELYNYNKGVGLEAAVIVEADALDKIGFHGVYTFFSKWTIRGKNLEEIIVKHLPGELTYANNIERVIFTEAGKRISMLLKKRTLDYYEVFLTELELFGYKFSINCINKRDIDILYIVKNKEVKEVKTHTEKREKCEWFEIEIIYDDGEQHKASFCLPRPLKIVER